MKPRRENPETALVRAALDVLQTHGISAYRSNTGVAWRSKKSKVLLLDKPDGSAIPVKFGIPGTPDIIGWVTRRRDSPERRATCGRIAAALTAKRGYTRDRCVS